MAGYDQRSGIAIGEVLKANRTRQGLDIRTVEERTKIRTKYLRALENEEWEVLPSPAYAKGFLRTYAQLLGLDGDALADEFRRQVEVAGRSYPTTERVLERRRRPGQPPRGPRWGAIAGAAALAAVAVLLVLGLTGGDDGGGDRAERREARQERQERRRERRQRQRRREAREAAQGEEVRLRLVMNDDVPVCLVADGGRTLLTGQVVAAGTEESFTAGRFRLAFPSGYDPDQVRLVLNGERQPLPEASGATAYRIVAPGRVREADAPGQRCP